MKIAFHSQSFCVHDWQRAFNNICPQVTLHNVSDGDSNQYPDITALLLWKPTKKQWCDTLPNLSHVFYLGASLEAHDSMVLPQGVTVHRLHDAGMKTAMCDYAEYAVLHFQRRFDVFQQAQRQQQWVTERDYEERNNIHVLILGLGSLGSAVATHLASTGYQVTGGQDHPRQSQAPHTAGIASESAVRQCNILINLLPITAETHHFLNAERIAWLSTSSAIISLSRGAIIDTQALLNALDNHQLRGAFLDVFETEPLAETIHYGDILKSQSRHTKVRQHKSTKRFKR